MGKIEMLRKAVRAAKQAKAIKETAGSLAGADLASKVEAKLDKEFKKKRVPSAAEKRLAEELGVTTDSEDLTKETLDEALGRQRIEERERREKARKETDAAKETVAKSESAEHAAEKAAEQARKAAEQAAGQSVQRAAGSGKVANTGTMMGDVAAGSHEPEGEGNGGSGSTMVTLLFLWAVIVQVFDAYVHFSRPNQGFTIFAYMSIAVWAFVVFKSHGIIHGGDIRRLLGFSAISLFYVLIPFFVTYLPKSGLFGGPSFFEWLSFFLAILPLWPLYIGTRPQFNRELGKWVRWYINFWIIFIMVLAIIYFSLKLQTGTVVAMGGRPELLEATTAADFLMEKTVETFQKMWKGADFQTNVEKLLNASGIGYYTGTVDENEKAPVGLYIDNVRPIDPNGFFVGDPVVVWADISGKSFNELISVTPGCVIDGKEPGVPDPKRIQILGQEQQSLSCTFEGLPVGSHRVRVISSFNFETWAYVTYTFVDLELKRAMQVQGKDVNRELDVPRLPEAVYTNGPVLLGMGSMVEQPIGVDVKNNNREPVLGVTIDNQWTDGHIEKVNKFVIQVPPEFKLVKCDRWPPGAAEHDYETDSDGYKLYEFSREELGDVRSTFSSITCRLQIENPEEFLSGQQKVQRTFVVRASYDYILEKSTTVRVRE